MVMGNMGNMDNIQKEYTNGEITVTWRPHLCDHSAICLLKLPKVFDNTKRPWINMDAANTEAIINTVNDCPTLALSYRVNNDIKTKITESINKKTEVILIENGPIRINGDIEIKNENGTIISNESKISLCRCGKSIKMPYCDGAHRK